MITPADLHETVYRVGGYFEADGKTASPYTGPGIRTSNTPKSSSGKHHDKDSDENKHFIQGSNPLSFSLKEEVSLHPKDVPVYKLNFRQAGVTNKIIYLPYLEKNITSTVIPTDDESVCYFITDEMSGCNFFIDKLPDGKLVCYHANADAQDTMDTQHSTAHQDYSLAENVASLRVAEYYTKAQDLVDRKIKMGRTDVGFWGGTTIMGFRVAGQWEFWFQTYSRLSYKRTGLAGFFKGKEVRLQDTPLEIVDFKRFWPKEG